MAKYKSSDIVRIVEDYISYNLHSDLNSGLIFGCDCGCGGDYYAENPEAWEQACEAYDESEEAFIKMCEDLGVETDD